MHHSMPLNPFLNVSRSKSKRQINYLSGQVINTKALNFLEKISLGNTKQINNKEIYLKGLSIMISLGMQGLSYKMNRKRNNYKEKMQQTQGKSEVIKKKITQNLNKMKGRKRKRLILAIIVMEDKNSDKRSTGLSADE